MHGMLKSLDPYSEFFSAEEYKKFNEAVTGSFVGIGAGLEKNDDASLPGISFVIPGSPAAQAGLKAGDRVKEVDGTSAALLTTDELVSKIRGQAGTSVTLTIVRTDPASPTPLEFKVTVQRAPVESVNILAKMLPGQTGYVYYGEFRPHSTDALLDAIDKLKAQGAKSLILDLRMNPGGALDDAGEIAGAFLRKGQAIVTLRDRDGNEAKGVAGEDGRFADLPLKVLVDGGSASASEIFAGAMQDHKRAVIYGERTFGKGVGQSVIPVEDGSVLKLTTFHWFTPDGHSIQKDASGVGGITPDIQIPVAKQAEAKIVENILRTMNGGTPKDGVEDPILERALQ
jgi:carboxyl-terminal processing protease